MSYLLVASPSAERCLIFRSNLWLSLHPVVLILHHEPVTICVRLDGFLLGVVFLVGRCCFTWWWGVVWVFVCFYSRVPCVQPLSWYKGLVVIGMA